MRKDACARGLGGLAWTNASPPSSLPCVRRFLKLRSMRLIDLFRYREFNTSTAEAGPSQMGDMGGSGDMMLSPAGELTRWRQGS